MVFELFFEVAKTKKGISFLFLILILWPFKTNKINCGFFFSGRGNVWAFCWRLNVLFSGLLQLDLELVSKLLNHLSKITLGIIAAPSIPSLTIDPLQNRKRANNTRATTSYTRS